MTYLEAVELIRQIEDKYDVMSVKYKGISVWPHLRLYLLDGVSGQTEIKGTGPIIKVVFRSLFAYNPFSIFKHHTIWLFTGCERRKRIDGKMIHRISGGFSASNCDYLMIEKTNVTIGHYKREEIEEKNIISEAWLLVLFHLIQVITRPFNQTIENEGVLKTILNDYKLRFDYGHYVRSLNAKRLSLLCLIKLTKRPKLAVIECPYNSMGYVWAFHQKGVKVLEMQHGVAGRSHNAYNAKAYEPILNPDGICVFGSAEFTYFTEEEPQYTPKVYMTGLYMLEKADEYFKQDVFGDYRNKYDKVVVCSGQNGCEDKLSLFINETAADNSNLMFIYIPRSSNADISFTEENVVIVRDVNIYQYLKWADIHITISSTTCLEAQYFETPTIFYDFNKMASTYYSNLLKAENGAIYISESKEFSNALSFLKQNNFTYLEVFAHKHIDKIKTVIQQIIK